MLHHTCKILIIIHVHINVHIHVDVVMLTNNYVHSQGTVWCTTCPPCWNCMETCGSSQDKVTEWRVHTFVCSHTCMDVHIHVHVFFPCRCWRELYLEEKLFLKQPTQCPSWDNQEWFQVGISKTRCLGSWKLWSWKEEVHKEKWWVLEQGRNPRSEEACPIIFQQSWGWTLTLTYVTCKIAT